MSAASCGNVPGCKGLLEIRECLFPCPGVNPHCPTGSTWTCANYIASASPCGSRKADSDQERKGYQWWCHFLWYCPLPGFKPPSSPTWSPPHSSPFLPFSCPSCWLTNVGASSLSTGAQTQSYYAESHAALCVHCKGPYAARTIVPAAQGPMRVGLWVFPVIRISWVITFPPQPNNSSIHWLTLNQAKQLLNSSRCW